MLYSFCRAVDDAIDERPAAEGPEGLRAVARRVDEVYGSTRPSSPLVAAMRALATRRKIPRLYLDELVAGMRMDVVGHRYRTVEDLHLYAHRVAGVVGLMMCHVLGVAHDDALRPAAHLGWAMQMTNIARDVQEDWSRGRMYLPEVWLETELPTSEIPAHAVARLAEAVQKLLAHAARYYRSADRGLAMLDARSAFGIRSAAAIYAEIGEVIRSRGFDVTLGRAVVPSSRKLWLTGRALRSSVLQFPHRLWSARGAPRSTRLPPPALTLRFEDLS